MGDRTHTTISIHKFFADKMRGTENLGDGELAAKFDCDELEQEDGDITIFVCYEANYATLETLETYLHENKIDYDKSWESGGDYEAGEEYARKVNGEYMVHSLTAKQHDVLGTLKTLIELKEDPAKLMECLENTLLELEPFEQTQLNQPQSIDFIKNA